MNIKVGVLKGLPGVDCIAANIGCGYFDEHCEDEVTSIVGFENCLNFVYELIKAYGYKKWHHVAVKPTYMPTKLPSKVMEKWQEEYGTEVVEMEPWVNGVDYISVDNVGFMEAQKALSENECPCCLHDKVLEDVDGMVYCDNCNSYWNIPSAYNPAWEV